MPDNETNAGTPGEPDNAGGQGEGGQGEGDSASAEAGGSIQAGGSAEAGWSGEVGSSPEAGAVGGAEADDTPSGLGEPSGAGQGAWGEPTETETLAPVLLMAAPPQEQSRWKTLLRLILVIPHVITLYALGIAVGVLLIIGWFGALFTARLPQFVADFLTGYLRWYVRVTAYTMLLTDVYPPFTLEDADYPVRIAVRPGRLNRLAVLFRYFLLIPVGIVAALLFYGAFTIVAFVAWLIVLITGRMPDGLHQAYSAVLRYGVRVYGFEYMLTSAYPAGLFGDEPDATPTETEPTQPWKLVLSSGAKNLVGMFLVLGVLVFAGAIAGSIAAGNGANSAVTNSDAANTIQSDFTSVNNALNGYTAKAQACSQQLSCLTALDRSMASTINTFGNQLRSINVSGSTATQALSALEAATSQTTTAFSTLGSATTATEYNGNIPALQQAATALGTAYNNIGTVLNGSS